MGMQEEPAYTKTIFFDIFCAVTLLNGDKFLESILVSLSMKCFLISMERQTEIEFGVLV